MHEITRLLESTRHGPPADAEELLPLVYDELRRMARSRMAGEAPGHTLQPTALVHEAWLRVAGPGVETWQSRAHFFGAASEAMRRILVEHARRKRALKRGGAVAHDEYDDARFALAAKPDELLAVHDALEGLARQDPQAAELVKLRYFVGFTMEEAAETLGLAKRTAEALWTYARVRMQREIRGTPNATDELNG